MRDVKRVAQQLNYVLLAWIAARFVNQFLFFYAQHVALHTEAKLLLRFLCNTSEGYKISGALVDCGQARSIVASKTFALTYAAEHAIRAIVFDAWQGAAHELSKAAKLVALISAAFLSAGLSIDYINAKAHVLMHRRAMYGENTYEAIRSTPALPRSVGAGRSSRHAITWDAEHEQDDAARREQDHNNKFD